MTGADAHADPETPVEDPKPLAGLAGHIRLAYSGFIFLSVVNVIVSGVLFGFLYGLMTGSIPFGDDAAQFGTMIDMAGLAAAIPYYLLFLWCVIITGRWTYRAMKNLKLTGRDDTVSPGWAVGWYFIPFANLWMPFKAMQEIWHGSHNTSSEEGGRVPAAMGWWWALWVFGGITSDIASRVSGGIDEDVAIERMMWGAAISVAAMIMLLISAYLLMGVIARISKAQDEEVLRPNARIFA